MKKRGEGIIRVSTLFEKYKKTLRAPEKSVTNQFLITVREIFPQLTIKESQCLYSPQTKTLSIQISGPVKTEIILKKETILLKMKDALGERSVPRNIL